MPTHFSDFQGVHTRFSRWSKTVDSLLPDMVADTVLGDKGYDDAQVIEALQAQGKTAVIPPRGNRQHLREYDKELSKAHHLIENFFAKLKQD